MNKFPLSLDRLVPDPDVESDHHRNGQPEGGHDRHDGHVLVRVDELKVKQEEIKLGGSSGLVVMGDDSCSKGRVFESRRRFTGWTFFHSDLL